MLRSVVASAPAREPFSLLTRPAIERALAEKQTALGQLTVAEAAAVPRPRSLTHRRPSTTSATPAPGRP